MTIARHAAFRKKWLEQMETDHRAAVRIRNDCCAGRPVAYATLTPSNAAPL
jgi:hypothetical protein